jgi:hypothetical protein
MKRSFFALALALGVASSLAGVARADQTAAAPAPVVNGPTAGLPVEQQALDAYRHNVNPEAVVPSTGIYDDSDRFTGPRGNPLPGWGSVRGEGAGDSGG